MRHIEAVHQLTSLSNSQLLDSVNLVAKSRSFVNELVFSNKLFIPELTAKTSLSKDKFWKRKQKSDTWSINEMLEVVSFFQQHSRFDLEEENKLKELSQALGRTQLFVSNIPTFLTIQNVSTEMILKDTSLTKDKYYYRMNKPPSLKFTELIELLNFVESIDH